MHPSVPCDILLDRTRKEIYGGILVSYTARCHAVLACFFASYGRPASTSPQKSRQERRQPSRSRAASYQARNRPPKHRFLVNNNHKKPRRSYNGHERE